MQGLELERVQELGEPGETRWGRLRGGALQWGVHSSGSAFWWGCTLLGGSALQWGLLPMEEPASSSYG